MFGSENHNNQQSHNDAASGFGSPASTKPIADGSLGSDDNTSAPELADPNNGLVHDVSTPDPTTPSTPSSTSTEPLSIGKADDLLGIKQNALQDLSPLVDHIDQTPEEKFRTTMMMIQASDDQSLVKTAYETAQKISDDKARAQALLDVINEINYFTQQHHN